MALTEIEHTQLLTWLEGTHGPVTAVDVSAGLTVSLDEGERLLRGLIALRPATLQYGDDGILSVNFDRDPRWTPERVRSRIRWRRWRRGLLARVGAALIALDFHLRWLVPTVGVLLIGVAGGIDSWNDPASSLMQRWIHAIVGGCTYGFVICALIYGAFAWWGTGLIVGALVAVLAGIHQLGQFLLRPLGPATHAELVGLIAHWASPLVDAGQTTESPEKRRNKRSARAQPKDSDGSDANLWGRLLDVMRAVKPAQMGDMWQLARAQRGRYSAADMVGVTGWTGAKLDDALVELAAIGEGDVHVDEQARIIWVLSELDNESPRRKPPAIWEQMDAVAAAGSVDDTELAYELLFTAGFYSWPMAVCVYWFPDMDLGAEVLAHGVIPPQWFTICGAIGIIHMVTLIGALLLISFMGRLRNRWLSTKLARRAVLARLYNQGRFDVQDVQQLVEALAWPTDEAGRETQITSILAEISTTLRLEDSDGDALVSLR